MTMVAMGGSDMVGLATLMLDVDDARAAADDQELRAARDAQRQELERQVREIHKEADETRLGAFVGGGMTLVGSAVSIVGTATEPIQSTGASQTGAAFTPAEKRSKLAIEAGQALSSLAQPTSALLGGSAEKDAEARAKQHEALAADAGARVAQAEQHHQRVLDEQDRTLSTLQSTLQSEADGNLAILANA